MVKYKYYTKILHENHILFRSESMCFYQLGKNACSIFSYFHGTE